MGCTDAADFTDPRCSIEQEDCMAPDAPQPYGGPLALAAAKKFAAPALAEAAANNWAMAVAVVDAAGDLVYFERMDATQAGSVTIAVDKARWRRGSSARPRRFRTRWRAAARGGACWTERRGAGGRRRPDRHRRQDRRRDRRLGRHERARWPVRPGRCSRGRSLTSRS